MYCNQLLLQFALVIETARVGSAPIDILLNNTQPAAALPRRSEGLWMTGRFMGSAAEGFA